ncbi:MOSC domain-containing protein [Halobacterium jilantaiense]|uniref:MOSC domain-containing protein n=1 Tax=Halobacterium jilantaiense TaxID=355548 RepID=A0A1I0QC97_9EURY|nr:MOSC N-terminal beta barrel domain-containing protein [Halobacterium jilantaiense]SEW24674.1 hypothetical protein SAMN04487945_2478 [Halobacterium jilantaiense]
MAHIAGLRVFPVKGLDGEAVERAALRPGGTLADDRAFALVEGDGNPVNAKEFPALHEFRTDYDPDAGTLAVTGPDGDHREFGLGTDSGRAAAGDWFADRLDAALSLVRADEDAGFVDRPSMGPSVVSTATLDTVASWFDSLGTEGVRRRLRANVEVGGVPAFWEDRFVGEDAPTFEAGGVRFAGVTPCNRCVVPSRDPDTGESVADFRQTFLRERERSFPEWADWDAFDHYYAVMILARATGLDGDEVLAVGDDVTVHVEPPEGRE